MLGATLVHLLVAYLRAITAEYLNERHHKKVYPTLHRVVREPALQIVSHLIQCSYMMGSYA